MKLAALALATVALATTRVSALTTTAIKKNCLELTSCFKGGVKANTCDISKQTCPPCVTFENSGCFDASNGVCPTWTSDCSTYWNGEDGSAGSDNSGNAAGNNSSASKNATSTPAPTTASPASNSSDTAGTAGSAGSQEEDSSDLSLVFAIIGAAMGVIAVAVIFLTLVRRSRAAREEDDEDATTPQALAKEPVSSTAAVNYAPIGRGRNASSGATAATLGKDEPTTAASYYSQQPQNLPIASPRMAGRAVPASATRPQPLPNPVPMARAMPVFSNAAPLGGVAQQQQPHVPVAVQEYYQAPAPAPTQAPAAVAAPRRVSSPRNRRESFEF